MSADTDTLTLESMSVLAVGRWKIRVWREENTDGAFNRDDLRELEDLMIVEGCDNPVEIAKRFCALDRVSAVEAVNYEGNGAVLYKNWPQ